MLDCCQKRLDWYLALFVYSTYPHTHKGNQTMKEEEGKSKKKTLLELKRKVGAPKLGFSTRYWRKR